MLAAFQMKNSPFHCHKQLVATLLALMLAGLILAFNCCSRAKSDRQLILDLIESLESLAEKKYTASILDCLSDSFRDMEDRSKTEIEDLLNHYFDKYSGIVVHILSSRFLDLQKDKAEVETDVSLSSGAARMFRNLIAYSGQTYRFSLRLEKRDGVWEIGYAGWQYIYLHELFPESMKVLKKLFPKL
jgi:hypothetical protein